jgi:uncharacterized membrane protein YedE/YeeE
MRRAIPFLAGVLFAAGLCISGMTEPMKVQHFLDFAGTWDPSLAFVMGGAILAHFGVVIWAKRAQKPIAADRFVWPEFTVIDARLMVGSALFGIGWGLSGYCPGPALVSIGAASQPLLAFLVAMTAGTFGARFFLDRQTESAAATENGEGAISRS